MPESALSPKPRPGLWCRLIRADQLLLFLAGGALIFVSYGALALRSVAPILVDDAVRGTLVDDFEATFGRAPEPEELGELQQGSIDTEILFREAIRRRIRLSDQVTRDHLVETMRRRLNGAMAPPDEAVLKAYLTANLERYGETYTAGSFAELRQRFLQDYRSRKARTISSAPWRGCEKSMTASLSTLWNRSLVALALALLAIWPANTNSRPICRRLPRQRYGRSGPKDARAWTRTGRPRAGAFSCNMSWPAMGWRPVPRSLFPGKSMGSASSWTSPETGPTRPFQAVSMALCFNWVRRSQPREIRCKRRGTSCGSAWSISGWVGIT
jgi:hypothetical protein